MSNLSSINDGVKFLLIAVDVFSRLAYVIHLRNKSMVTLIDAFVQIVNETKPSIINCDKGSEWISTQFKKLCRENNCKINYVDVGDHHKLGIVDRFVRTLRGMINKYMAMHNTTKYVNVIDDLVENYNTSYHSGIKMIPDDVQDKEENIIKLTTRKYNLAKKEETLFEVGDKVRCVRFEKKSLPKWGKTIHEIISKTEHMLAKT